jgi:CubicO group peptidase (beta-lactamase class C family)
VTPTRWRAEAALALFFAVVMVAGTGVLYFACTPDTVHTDSAAIRSAAADVDAGPHTGAVEEARRLARALLVEQNVPGLSVAVAVDGAVVWAEGFGYADVDRTPVTPLTRFRLGALSKPLTAVAAAVLHDRGRLDLDAPVHRYVRGYPDKRWTVTTRQLMGDVAGVHRIRGDNNDAMPDRHCESLDEAVAMLANDPLLFEPGTEHRYSIWGWVLVSAAVEGAAGEPFGRFMVRQVFEPLAMERTSVAESGVGPDHAPRYQESVVTTGLLLSSGRWRVSLHADGPGAIQHGDAEARAIDIGDDRRLPDAHAARVWSLHDLFTGLDTQHRPTRWRAGPDGQSPWKSPGRHRLPPDVP